MKISRWLEKTVFAPMRQAPRRTKTSAAKAVQQARNEIRSELSLKRVKEDLTARAPTPAMKVQCLIFPATTPVSEARAVARQRGVKVRSVRTERQRLILEQAPADHFVAGSLRTRPVGDGVLEVVGDARPSSDRLAGGRADGRSPRSFSAAELRAGTRVELEHTSDPSLAREIAMDHLAEDPLYYQRLKKIHTERRR